LAGVRVVQGFAGSGNSVPPNPEANYSQFGPTTTVQVNDGESLLVAGTFTATCPSNTLYGYVYPRVALCAVSGSLVVLQSGSAAGWLIQVPCNVVTSFSGRGTIPVSSGSWSVGFCAANRDSFSNDVLDVNQVTGWVTTIP
jgi:hypothetical protein